MDSTSTWLCCLCLQKSDDVVNIFDNFQNTTIASILSQHFWFQVSKGDGISECLCQICWINTKTFHIFYEAVELLQKDYWNSVNSVEPNCIDSIKQDRSDSPSDSKLEIDLSFCEDTVVISESSKEEIFDLDDDATCEQSEVGPTPLNDNDQSPKEKPRKNCLKGEKRLKSKRKPQTYEFKYKNDYLDAQLLVYFNMKCDICGDPLETYRGAKKHYRRVHKTNGYLICCGRKFHLRSLVLKHIDYHLDPNVFSCDQCGRQFIDKYSLDCHIESHEPFSSRAFKCDLCPKSFMRECRLVKHKDFVHCPVKCADCNVSYPSKSKLTTHIKNVHQARVTTTRVCDICGKDLANKHSLAYHMQHIHPTNPNPKCQCDICGTWVQHTELKRHIKCHRLSPSKCSVCGKVKKNEGTLAIHMRLTHSERRHQCTICGKKFKKLLVLKEHMAGHTGEDLYKCEYCTRSFKSSGNMYAHRKKMHLAEWTQDRSKTLYQLKIN